MGVDVLQDEEGRLCTLNRFGLPAKFNRSQVDHVLTLAAHVLDVPMAGVSIITRDRQVFLSADGFDVQDSPREGSLAALAIADTDPLIIEDCRSDPRYREARIAGAQPAGYLGVPLLTETGYAIGCLEFFDTVSRQFSDDEVVRATAFAQVMMGALSAYRPERFDNLTGAMTRHQFMAEVEREFERAVRYERPAALVFIDVDGFAELNNALGLETADQVLKSIANHSIATLRSTDLFGRIGGSEFAMLLPETLAYEASQCAERLRETIARLRFRQGENVYSTSCSFGVAPLNPSIKSAHLWFAQADVAVYQAKQAGRNCVMFAPGPDADEPVSGKGSEIQPVGELH